MDGDRRMTLAEDIEKQAGEEQIISAVIGDMGWSLHSIPRHPVDCSPEMPGG